MSNFINTSKPEKHVTTEHVTTEHKTRDARTSKTVTPVTATTTTTTTTTPHSDVIKNELTVIEEEYHIIMKSLHSMSKEISTMANQLSLLYTKTNKVLKKVEGSVPNACLYDEYKHENDSESKTFSVSNVFLNVLKTKQSTFTKLEVMDQIHTYIKKQSLLIQPDTREITCDDGLKLVFGTDTIQYFDLSSLVDKHVLLA